MSLFIITHYVVSPGGFHRSPGYLPLQSRKEESSKKKKIINKKKRKERKGKEKS